MRLTHLAASVAFALFSTVASAQHVTVHSDGVTGDYASIQEAVNAVLADPASPDVIEILDEGPFVGPAIAVNDTPVDGVQPFNVTDITFLGAEGVKPILASTALSSVFNFSHVYGRVHIKNLILTGATPNESSGSVLGPQRGISLATSAGNQDAAGRAIDYLVEDVVITSSIRTQEDPPIFVPLTLDGLTIAGINAALPEGELCTFRLEGINVGSTSQSIVNKLEFRNSVISAMPRAAYGFRTFFDGGPGTEVLLGPDVVISYVTGPLQGAGQVGGGIQVGGNDGSLHIFKAKGTPEKPLIIHGNNRGADLTGATPVGSIKSFENVIISNSLREGILPRHPTENFILQNVTIVNSGQEAGFDDQEPITNGSPWPFEAWGGSYVADSSIIAGNGSEHFRNLIRVVSDQDPSGFADFTDSGIVLNGPFKLNTTDYDQDGFDGFGDREVTLTDVLSTDPQFISTTLGHPDFYRPGATDYVNAGILGAYSEGTPIPPSSVTVHSDGVSGDFGTIQAAINAVQGNPTGVGVVTILDEGPFVQAAISIPGGGLDEITLRGAPGVRPIIAGTAASSVIDVNNFYGRVVMENLLLTSATETGPVRAVRYTTTAANHTTAGTPIDYVMDNVIITSSVRTQDDPPVFVPVTTDGITVLGVNAALPDGVYCNIRGEAVRGDSNSSTIVSRVEFKNSIISGLPIANYGYRSFFDGGEGTELIIGPNVIISYVTGPGEGANFIGGALQVGGNEGSPHILKVRGTIDEPVFLHGNRRGVELTGATPGQIKSFWNVLISDSLEEGFRTHHPAETYNLNNVTIVNSGQAGTGASEAFTFGLFPDTAWNGQLTSSGTIFAGNGSSEARNVIRTYTEAAPGGSALLQDGAVVLNGSFQLTGDGFTDTDPSNVTSVNNLNSDPQFISTTFGHPDFYRPGAVAYTSAGVLGVYGDPVLPPAFVTVHSDGVTGDFDNIQNAVNAVMASESSQVTVEILDDGPFIQSEITVTPNSPTVQSFTLRGAEGARPLIVGVGGGPGGINSWAVIRTNHFYGEVNLENLVVVPGEPVVGESPLRAIWLQTAAGNQNTAGRAANYTIDNVLMTSAVRTSTDPLTYVPVTTDGITVAGFNAPAIGGDLCTIRNEVIRVDSTSNNFVNRLALQNSIISGMSNAADAFRTFFDGAEGTEVLVGPNVLITFVIGTVGGGGAIQVGGNEGSDHILKVEGTPEQPIILHGNRRGVALTNTTRAGSIKSFRNVIISDSLEEGFRTGDLSEDYIFENVTIVNSGTSINPDGAEAFTPTATGWTGSLMTINAILAGKGTDGVRNVVNVFSDADPAGTAHFEDGAIVLNGPFRLAGDGIIEAVPSNVTDINNLNSDPEFISTTLGHPDFYRPGAAAYISAEVLGAYGDSAFTPPDGELGDINNDGVINVADVTELANIIAAGNEDQLSLDVADINNDGVINEADVTALAEMIVN